MFLPIIYFCTTTRSGRFGQAIVDTVKFLLPIATRNLLTSVNINLNASIKKISAIGCARHQIDQSIKFPQSFCSVNDNIVCDLSGYALFASLDCIVRDRLSSNASNSSTNGISKRPATLRKASRVGEVSPLNHLDQTLISTPVSVLNALYERFKNLSLFFDSQAYISFLNRLSTVSHAANNYAIFIITQTTKHLLTQVLVVNRSPRKGGVIFQKLYEHYKRMWGRSQCPSFTMPSYADMGEGVVENNFTPIPTGREGYIYLIHTLDTNRYKIGRSVNPIVRAADIQKQSPYKLQLIKSSWTPDAPGDEAVLHREFAPYRIHGEWFELERDNKNHECYWAVNMAFDTPPTLYKAANVSMNRLSQYLELDLIYHSVMASTGADILDLYGVLISKQEIQLTQGFFSGTLQSIIRHRYFPSIKESLTNEEDLEGLVCFIAGAITAFKIMVLKKGGALMLKRKTYTPEIDVVHSEGFFMVSKDDAAKAIASKLTGSQYRLWHYLMGVDAFADFTSTGERIYKDIPSPAECGVAIGASARTVEKDIKVLRDLKLYDYRVTGWQGHNLTAENARLEAERLKKQKAVEPAQSKGGYLAAKTVKQPDSVLNSREKGYLTENPNLHNNERAREYSDYSRLKHTRACGRKFEKSRAGNYWRRK